MATPKTFAVHAGSTSTSSWDKAITECGKRTGSTTEIPLEITCKAKACADVRGTYERAIKWARTTTYRHEPHLSRIDLMGAEDGIPSDVRRVEQARAAAATLHASLDGPAPYIESPLIGMATIATAERAREIARQAEMLMRSASLLATILEERENHPEYTTVAIPATEEE